MEGRLATTAGTCAVMGTASTMACIAEALGMILPGTAAIPAVHADRLRAAEATGAAAVRLIKTGLTPDQHRHARSRSRTRCACCWRSAARPTRSSISPQSPAAPASRSRSNGSTRLSDTTPVLVNLKPVGNGYMEDFFAAGGIGALLREMRDLLHLDCLTVTGETLGERLAASEDDYVDRNHHRRARQAARAAGRAGRAVRQSGAGGAILKRSAADSKLFEHEGRAVVFTSLADLAARIDDPELEVTPNDILVLQNAGPNATEAMPEAGYLPIPKKLATAGVKDMIRISDARMSGTAFGTIVLHITPDAASGGPLALVRTGRPHPAVGQECAASICWLMRPN